MGAASFRWILQLHKDVPKAAKLYSEGLDFTINVCTLRWAELQSGSLKLALLHSPSQSEKPSAVVSGPAAEDPAVSRDAIGGQELVTVEWHGEFMAVCKWSIFNFPKVKARALWSKYFKVGGYDCRLLVYPKGNSQALPGYISIYLQIMDPRGTSSSK